MCRDILTCGYSHTDTRNTSVVLGKNKYYIQDHHLSTVTSGNMELRGSQKAELNPRLSKQQALSLDAIKTWKGIEVQTHSFLISAPDEGELSNSSSGRFAPGK